MVRTDLLERASSKHPFDARANTTILVASIVLSAMRLVGSDFAFLIPAANTWPSSVWTLFTTTLLHGDWLHLIFNVFWMLRLGTATEALIGPLAMAFFVVFAGMGSGAVEWAMSGPYVGLSGIVYGLFGLLWALDRWHPGGRGLMDSQTTNMLVLWFFLCILLSQSGQLAIANYAHGLGGLLGAVLGWSLSRPADSRGWRWFTFPLASMACVALPLLITPRPVIHAQWSALFVEGTLAIQEVEKAQDGGYKVDVPTLLAKAEEALRASLDVREDPDALWNLSITLLRQGKINEGLEMKERALELDPSLAETNSKQ